MRYDVLKFLFLGPAKERDEFFKAAQVAGIIEFIDPKGKKKHDIPQDIENLGSAIKVLRGFVQLPADHAKTIHDAPHFVKDILDLKTQLDSVESKLSDVEQELDRIMPFGEFSFDALSHLEQEIKRKVRFFAAKSAKKLSEIEPALILIKSQDGVDYFVAIQNEPIVFADLSEFYFTKSLSELNKEQRELTKEREHIEQKLKGLTIYNVLLHQALVARLNDAHLEFAKETTGLELESQLFIASGWVPKTKIAHARELCDRHGVYTEQVASAPKETPPTYLENKGTAKVGEDLIRIFDTPSIRDKDPSLWVLFAFALFFSMIVYDAGYGIIFLLAALFLRVSLKKSAPSTKRFISLIAILSVACILWGGLTHSFFGIEFGPNSFLRKHSLMTWLVKKKAAYTLAEKDELYAEYVKKYPDLQNAKTAEDFLQHHEISSKFADNILLELSLFIGTVHICLGLLRYLGRNPVGLGWIAFVIGAYLYIPYYLHASSLVHFVFGLKAAPAAQFGLQLLLFGIVFAAIAGVILHGVAGLFEWTHAIQLFADILSYLRIYALGYAGFIVSETVNMLAGRMPILLAVAVLIFGHILNMTIAILGGTIHGLRLNFLEWYRYSFFGGGKDFSPLQLIHLE